MRLPITTLGDLQDMADLLLKTLEKSVPATCEICGNDVGYDCGHDVMCPVYRWHTRDVSVCDCEYAFPFGFVISSGCDIHDK